VQEFLLPPGVFCFLLSPTFIITGSSYGSLLSIFAHFPCSEMRLFCPDEGYMKMILIFIIRPQNIRPESTKSADPSPIHFANLLSNSLLWQMAGGQRRELMLRVHQ
jgi:hypothetical protein